MSQFPVISPVSNVHPDDTFGEKPPTTDTDGDGIPDVHENIFEEWINFSAVDGRLVTMKGLDKSDASDADFDTDRDGLNNTEEYCWPIPTIATILVFHEALLVHWMKTGTESTSTLVF